MITQTPLLRTIKAYGQLLERDFNPLAKSLLLRTSDPIFSIFSVLTFQHLMALELFEQRERTKYQRVACYVILVRALIGNVIATCYGID